MPIFFIRDPMKFQNFIRSQKRLAANNLRDADMQWDFWTLSPESSHMLAWLMGDRGIPRSWRHMNGYSSHTYMWVNAENERFWVKYHFKTDQGIEFLTQADADRIAGEDADYHQRDLYTAIERGDFPSWTLKMQIMPFDEAKTYRFNPFDLTKVWPHGDYPLIDVGKLTLNRNVTDYHTEMEQAAFQPNNTVPGTGLSPDKMLLARGFSYADAHRARLGVNYQQIPVNRPRSPVRNYSKDGAMRVDNVTDPVYYPNSVEGAPAADTVAYAEHAVWAADGEMVRAAYTPHAEDDDYGQANTMINEVLDDAARDRLVDNVAGHAVGVQPARTSSRGCSSTGATSTRPSATGSRRPPSRSAGRAARPSSSTRSAHHRSAAVDLRRVKIEVWSDVVCPWCYVGSRNLAAALRSFSHADEVEVEWRSYELDPRRRPSARAPTSSGSPGSTASRWGRPGRA